MPILADWVISWQQKRPLCGRQASEERMEKRRSHERAAILLNRLMLHMVCGARILPACQQALREETWEKSM